MANPQQPELGRSRKTPAQDPDSVQSLVTSQRELEVDAPPGVVPPENRPGHRPSAEQDKPDLDAFAERLGVAPDDGETQDGAARGAESRGDAPAAATGKRGAVARVSVLVAAIVAAAALVIHRKRRRSRRR